MERQIPRRRARFLKGDRERSDRSRTAFSAAPTSTAHEDREPEQSINFVTCHDGFTLNDLVSYDRKHNEANGDVESRRQRSTITAGTAASKDRPTIPAVERLRNRQVKNFLALTMLAIGTPMLLMGDEVRRTQRGNNNAYCLNDETTWFDWDLLVDGTRDVHRFAKELIALRARPHPADRAVRT